MLYKSQVLLLTLIVGLAVQVTVAQTASQPVRVTRIHGPRAVLQDSIANYRATASEASTRPIEYLWDFGDGIASEGIVVAHRYETPGMKTITLFASNAAGRDTIQTTVVVTEPHPTLPEHIAAEPPSQTPKPQTQTVEAKASPSTNWTAKARRTLYSNSAIQPTSSGYTWVVASDLWRERLEAKAIDYILKGLRVELYTDSTTNGSPAYRLITGHFASVEEALAARPLLPHQVENPILLDLSEEN